MTSRTLRLKSLLLLILVGCQQPEPTNIATINNSGAELVGEFSVGEETAPFASGSIHTGDDSFIGGELAELKLINLWTGEKYMMAGRIPTRPPKDKFNTLILATNKNLSLDISWKDNLTTLQDKHVNYFRENFKTVPILIHNNGIRSDFIVNILQGKHSYLCNRSQINNSQYFINYGLFHIDKLTKSLILISYGPGVFTETHYINIPGNILKNKKNISALYISTDQNNSKARIYFLTNTPFNPREVAELFHMKQLHLPGDFLELETLISNKHIERRGFSIPDLSAIR